MKSKYEPVIGLEVHIETKSESKVFSADSAEYFGLAPNVHTSPTSLGLPGALPYTNEKAIEDCLKIGLALNCRISEYSVFERKNYFYPDLPKGYQISQYRWPLCRDGMVKVRDASGNLKRIRINRVHQEEDTGKLFHAQGQTMIDFNRSGVPLVEIVTEPDFRGLEEIKDYAKKLQRIFRYLDVSDADMEKGQMRLEANISVRRKGDKKLPAYRVELKNINSFRFMIAAVDYEIERQIKALENNKELVQETRGWNQQKRQTYVQRIKEESSDYRYFPDPDLPPLTISGKRVEEIKKELPELPDEKIERYIKNYGLSRYQAERLADRQEVALYFEESIRIGQKHGIDTKTIANTLINKKFDRDRVLPAKLIEILVSDTKRPTLHASEIQQVVVQTIKQFPKAVEDYKKGKTNAVQFLVGQAMKNLSGKADPKKLLAVFKTELNTQRNG